LRAAVVLRERAQDLLALRFLFAGAARLQALQFIHAAVDVAARLLDLLIERAALRRLALEDRKQAAGLAAEFPPYDEVLDPINRVFLPRADIATETLAEGLRQVGWEVEDVTAYRTVRATPPPAPTREAIKTGKFDAVVFTSSSTVRNLVGIAGKPHPSTVIAVIGPATARTCEEHGLRVDVIAAKPSVVDLADALASFAAQRRDAFLEAGEPVLKPSQRRPGTRRRV